MPIRRATTAGSRALIGMYSESGGGKTYSSLVLARGLAGPSGKIVLVDTENRRGEIYADDPVIGGYDVLPLGEPFSPATYDAAIQEAEEYGADVIIVDSGSHEWEGPGGVLDMASTIAENRAKRQNRPWNGEVAFGDWRDPKIAHKKLIQRMQRSSAHVIVCLRAQYKSHQIDKKDYEKYGIQSNAKTTVIRDDFQSPIQDANFIFELIVHMYFSNKNPGVPTITKCPDMLLDAFPAEKLITTATGARVAAFYEGGAPGNKAVAKLIQRARQAATKGAAAYQEFFTKEISADERRELSTLGEHEAIKTRLAQSAPPRLQDPPAEPSDDGRPDYGNDDPPPHDEIPEGPAGFEDDDAGDQPGYVPPQFDGF